MTGPLHHPAISIAVIIGAGPSEPADAVPICADMTMLPLSYSAGQRGLLHRSGLSLSGWSALCWCWYAWPTSAEVVGTQQDWEPGRSPCRHVSSPQLHHQRWLTRAAWPLLLLTCLTYLCRCTWHAAGMAAMQVARQTCVKPIAKVLGPCQALQSRSSRQ